MTKYKVTQSKLQLLVTSTPPFTDMPGILESAWRMAWPAITADIDYACAEILGTEHEEQDEIEAAKSGMTDIDSKLDYIGSGHYATALRVNPNSGGNTTYRPGGGGSHGGSARVLNRQTSNVISLNVMIGTGPGAVSYTCVPTVYILAAPVV